jgi:hypothetical protein
MIFQVEAFSSPNLISQGNLYSKDPKLQFPDVGTKQIDQIDVIQDLDILVLLSGTLFAECRF